MKVIKPTKLGIIMRFFEHERRFFASFGVLALHRFDGALSSEMDMWPFLSQELGQDGIPDAGMPKSRAEVLASGFAFSEGQAPQSGCTVRVQLGEIVKELWVYGDRYWTSEGSEDERPTEPEPFTQMPISWDTAFGGPDFDRNPKGKGHAAVATDGGAVHPLPNVELADQAVSSRRDLPEPAGLGPIDLTWPQRASKAGTYDSAWLKERSPGFAADLDWSIFNLASEDQQQDAPFEGNEPFRIYGMHPVKSWLTGRLPGLRARCFVNLKEHHGETFREVEMGLTTVWFFPHAERYLLVYHGQHEIAEEDGADVLQVVVAADRLGEERSVEHYRNVLAQRLDPERGGLYALRDRDLLPTLSSDQDEPDQAMEEMNAVAATEGLLEKNQRRRQEREIAAARAFVASQGLDPDVHGPPPLPPESPPPTPDELVEAVEKFRRDAERMREEAEEQKDRRKEAIRAELLADGRDADAILADLERPPAGPPRFSARAEMAMLRARFADRRNMGLPLDPMDEMAMDPDQPLRLETAEEGLREGYRLMAHHQGAAPRLGGSEAAAARAAALDSLTERGNLVRQDLTGADLSGLDLRGIDLRGAWLENADLSGTNLEGATLSEAVLARADLTGAVLTGASLKKANLGHTRLVRAQADRADFSEAILSQALLDQASFREATLSSADLKQAEFRRTDMTEATLREALFLDADLTGLLLAGADLDNAIFLTADVRAVDFSAASLVEASFVQANGEGAIFTGARMTKVRFVEACAFAGADFRGAALEGANLRGTNLSRTDFEGARLSGADLSDCDLRRANLVQTDATGARFVKANLSGARMERANLMNVLLQRADLSGADLRDANLFEADLARSLIDADTLFEGANLKRVRRDPPADPSQPLPQ
jgi:uncharacterized protein YjbI with pentapeptide repeats